MYVIQWTLINWGMYVFGFWKYDAVSVVALIPLMILLTVFVQKTWLIVRKKVKSSQVLTTA
jgi:hypothetical protein